MSGRRLRVAITQRVVENEAYPERRDALAHDWAIWAERVLPGSVLLPLPNAATSAMSIIGDVRPDVLILSGGNDLGTAPDREEAERAALAWFRRARRPVIGVCRGLHVLNDVFGGSVEAIPNRGHVATNHEIEVVRPLAGLAVGDTIEVNSYHAYGVTSAGLAPNLEAVAISNDGYVEALINPNEPILALQWHPERPDPSPTTTDALLLDLLRSVDSEASLGR